MKKFFAILTALMLAVTGCALAAAEAATVEPHPDIDMETYGNEDSTVNAALSEDPVDDTGCLIYSIYAMDLYRTQDIAALKPGDKLTVNGEEVTVRTIEQVDNGYAINGGFGEAEDGVTLFYVDGDPDDLYCQMEDDEAARTMVGQAAYQLAEKVTVRTFKMGEDGDYHGEYVEAVLAPADVEAYINTMTEQGTSFSSAWNTTVQLTDGKVEVITVEWGPNC